jgi:hypothetical protein
MSLAVLEIEIFHIAVVHELQNVSNREVSPTISVKFHISPLNNFRLTSSRLSHPDLGRGTGKKGWIREKSALDTI